MLHSARMPTDDLLIPAKTHIMEVPEFAIKAALPGTLEWSVGQEPHAIAVSTVQEVRNQFDLGSSEVDVTLKKN